MTFASVRAREVGLVAWLVIGSSLLSVGTSAGLTIGGIAPEINVAVSNGFLSVHYTRAGWPIAVDVMLLAKDATPPFASDVYVGIVAPDGQSTSLVGDGQLTAPLLAFEPVLVPGRPVALLQGVVLTGDTGGRLVIPSFAAGAPEGWYTFYGLIVAAGQDPGDPRQWIGSSFFPVQVTAPPGQ